MNKKKDIIALALSVSFVMGGASLSHADEINSDTTSYISENQQKETESSAQNLGNDDKNITEVKNDSEVKENENLLISEEKAPDSQQAGEHATSEPNYSEEEKNIKDYSGSERYKETDLQPGDTNQSLVNTDEKVEKDGFKFELKNPSASSPDKKAYGYEIVIDKKTDKEPTLRLL